MKYLKNVTSIKFHEDKCIACGMCLKVCPHEVFIFENNKVKLSKKDLCMECGACSKNCPVNAIEVKSGVG
jgi:NAD-dependent dihydropyrimidine dehydrogenase PreA subunit